MQQDKINSSDDWTRNWQARVAIKITAIFLWVIILSGFGLVIHFTKDLDKHIEDGVARDLDAIAYRVNTYLENTHYDTGVVNNRELSQFVENFLESRTPDVIDHSGISGVRVVVGEHDIDVGSKPEESTGFAKRHLLIADGSASRPKHAYLEAYYPDVKSNAAATRQRLILGVVFTLLLFGMLLSFTIQQVLSKPFNVLMDAIQGVSQGNLDLRLDMPREDEFGRLSRFFNQMMERVQIQQQELKEANRDLINEISVRKQAEQQLRANQDELEKLVEERTRDLAIARDHALAASQTKSAFIANISHEIRTPLTPIIGFAEALLQGGENKRECDQLLRTIIRNGKHLSQIINQILDLSKIEANSLDIEVIPVDLFTVFADVVSVAEMLAQEKGLVLEVKHDFPLPATISSDPTRIKQILMNLVTNAFKFTENGTVTMAVRYIEESRQIEFSVIDTGIGVRKDNIDKLFQPFSQADYSTTRQFGGTGLGLYISKKLARLLGGDITLESVEGVGTRCAITISTGDGCQPDLVDSVPAPRTDELKALCRIDEMRLTGRVLLAEDCVDIQRLMRYILGRIGVEVTVVENGEMAVEAALQGDFQLILMDMQMPVMSGIEAVELLHGAGCGTPIVALTANAMKEDRQRYQDVGCDDFLSKPIDLELLHQVLSRYLVNAQEAGKSPQPPGDDEADATFNALVDGFVAGLRDYARKISAAADENDFDVIRDLAHQLKGMGGSFGYPEITETAAALEATIKTGKYTDVSETARRFVDLLAVTAATSPAMVVS